MSDLEKQQTEKKHRLKIKKKIKFEREVVSKNEAQKLLKKSKEKHRQKPPKKQKKINSGEEPTNNGMDTKLKQKKINGAEESECLITNGLEVKVKKSKKKNKNNLAEPNKNVAIENIEPPKKKKKTKNSTEEENLISSDHEADADSKSEKTESIRARKRKKHQQLLEEKKLKADLNFQQKCLNYLSQWKHSKSTWKFEKLKQIWIQQNMFNDARIPDEFWVTVVEYFNKAQGKIKSTIMSDALKIIEGNVNSEENDEECDIKYKRARFVVQNLQE